MLPDRDAAPLPGLDDLGIGFLDECAEPAEHLAPPVAELLDPGIDRRRSRFLFRCAALLHAPLLKTRYAAGA